MAEYALVRLVGRRVGLRQFRLGEVLHNFLWGIIQKLDSLRILMIHQSAEASKTVN